MIDLRTRLMPFRPLLIAALAMTSWVAFAQLERLDLSVHESDLTPDITLREHENRTVEEFRVNNRLYMIRITPSVGAPYYLIDQDGSGDMGWFRDNSPASIQIPQWVLLRW